MKMKKSPQKDIVRSPWEIKIWIPPERGDSEFERGDTEFAGGIEGPHQDFYSVSVTRNGQVSAYRRIARLGTCSMFLPVNTPPRALLKLCRSRLRKSL